MMNDRRNKRMCLWLCVCSLICCLAKGGVVSFAAQNLPQGTSEHGFLASHTQTLFTDQNGLDVNETNDICQTRDGYIWVAHYSGLTRYDGRSFRTYNANSQPELPATGMISLYPDAAGRLWIGSNESGLLKLEDGVFSKIDGQGLGLSVRDITQDANRVIYVATSNGVGFLSEGGSLEPLPVPELAGIAADAVAVDSLGQLWVLASDTIFLVKDGVLTDEYRSKEKGQGGITSLYADPNGLVWAGTESGHVLWFQPKMGGFQLQGKLSLPLSQINSFYQDRDQQIWVCSDSGMAYLDSNFHPTQIVGAQITNSVEAIIQDYEGSYWVSSSRQGVLKLSKSQFLNMEVSSGLSLGVVNSTLPVWGQLYIATDDGLVILDEKGRRVENQITERLNNIRLRQLYLDSQNQVWISTYQTYGVIRLLQDGSYTVIDPDNSGLSADAVRSVLELDHKQMAVATNKGVDIVEQDRVVAHYGVEQGLKNPVILSMCQDNQGYLYAGSNGNGIYRIDLSSGQVDNLTVEQGLSTGVILRMVPDPDGKGIWISSGNQIDFYEYESGACGPVSQLRPFRSNVFDLMFLKDGRLLVLSATSMSIVDVSSFGGLGVSEPKMETDSYNRQAGLSATITANSWSRISQDETLYICMNPGVNAISVNEIVGNDEAPKIAVSDVWVDEKPMTGSRIIIPSDAARVSIYFSVLSYLDQSRLQVTYQLEGFDKEPITQMWSDTSFVSYTNLPGGTYVFRVSAQNGDGVFSQEPAFVTIMKERTIQESPVFLLTCGISVFFICSLFAIIYLRSKTNKIRQREQEYRDITEQSLQTIANTIDAKDTNTNGHSIRVAKYARELARRMHLSEQDQDHVYYSALLHDIGKIGIPDAILNKPGALTKEELDLMRSHSTIGGEILKDFHAIPDIHVIVSSHHENYDGGGYPNGISGEGIPLFAQIIRVADAFDAMASHRSYRASMTQMYILSELEKYSGIQFNPKIVVLMEEMVHDGFTSRVVNDTEAPSEL